MITEFVYEYVKHIHIPHQHEEWLIGPLDLDQYVVVLLIARANGFNWHIGYSPIELEQFFPIPQGSFTQAINRQQLVAVSYNLNHREIAVGAFDFGLLNVPKDRVMTLYELMEEFNDY